VQITVRYFHHDPLLADCGNGSHSVCLCVRLVCCMLIDIVVFVRESTEGSYFILDGGSESAHGKVDFVLEVSCWNQAVVNRQ